MPGPTITTDELRSRLLRAGQLAPEDDAEGSRGTDVWPTPETIVTVGWSLDPTLRPEYRRRYFVCRLTSGDDPSPALEDDPAFAPPGPFREAAAAGPAGDAFLAGPVRWLLRRIARFDALLFWPASLEEGPAFLQPGLLEEFPGIRDRLPADLPGRSATGAIVLDPHNETDARLLWEAEARVSQTFFDFFVSDPECREVYRMHHHGKVEVSVPDEPARRAMIDELASRPDLIEDVSGFISDWDDEDDEAAPPYDGLDPDAVHDRESFLAFVAALAADRRAAVAAEKESPSSPYGPDAGGWENLTIEDFLEAAIAWAESGGRPWPFPAEPSWRAFATFLYCGKIYE